MCSVLERFVNSYTYYTVGFETERRGRVFWGPGRSLLVWQEILRKLPGREDAVPELLVRQRTRGRYVQGQKGQKGSAWQRFQEVWSSWSKNSRGGGC